MGEDRGLSLVAGIDNINAIQDQMLLQGGLYWGSLLVRI